MDFFTSLFDAPETVPTVPVTQNDPNAFGCCSSYAACSDAKRCLIADREYSIHCTYRKNLEAGRIFYGKNAEGFSRSRYDEIQQRVDTLAPEIRAIFDNILVNMCEYNRASWSCVVRNLFVSELASVGLFEFQLLGSSFPPIKPEKWNYDKLLSPTVEHQYYGPLFAQAQNTRKAEREPLLAAEKEAKDSNDQQRLAAVRAELKKLPGENTKEFMRWWLNTSDGIPWRDLLAAPYRFAFLPPSNILYAEELYRETLLSNRDSHIYPRSPWWEDGMLSMKTQEDEEERRVKLSPGYSPEEKEQLLAPIYQARTLRTEKRRKKNLEQGDSV